MELIEPSTTPSAEEVRIRQLLFCETFTKYFNKRRTKFANILLFYRKSMPCLARAVSSRQSDTMEEEIELVLRDSQSRLKSRLKRNSGPKLSSICGWIFQVVKYTKASRILSRIQDIPEWEILAVLDEVSRELSTTFEYQIVMLANEEDVGKLAEHATICIFHYLKDTNSCFNARKCLEAVLELKIKEFHCPVKTPKIPTKLKYRWKIDSIFKKPGLRIKVSDEGMKEMYQFRGCFTPWGFSCKPNKYGFRSPIHALDEETNEYTLLYNDQVSMNPSRDTEVPFWPENVHQSYEPLTHCEHSRPVA